MLSHIYLRMRGRRVRIVVGFTTTFAISAYHLKSCEFESRLWRSVLDTTVCDKVFHDLR
jgi:translation initiation factor IF-1